MQQIYRRTRMAQCNFKKVALQLQAWVFSCKFATLCGCFWKSFNRLDQYNRRNNLEIQGIPSSIGDDVLEDKVIEIFECLNIPLAKTDIEDSHRLGKSNPKNAIVRFVNRRNCYAGLSKKMDLRHIYKVKLCFPEVNLIFN